MHPKPMWERCSHLISGVELAWEKCLHSLPKSKIEELSKAQ